MIDAYNRLFTIKPVPRHLSRQIFDCTMHACIMIKGNADANVSFKQMQMHHSNARKLPSHHIQIVSISLTHWTG